MDDFGLSPSILQSIISTCKAYNLEQVILYGSRSRGDFKEGADIDIAIDAPQMNAKEFSKLWNALDDLPIIYTLDIVHLQSLHNQMLLDNIKKDGHVIFKKTAD